MITAGVDAGMRAVKISILDEKNFIADCVIPCGKSPTKVVAERALDQAIRQGKIRRGDLKYIVGTGMGRASIPSIDEIATQSVCVAKGCYEISKSIRTIIDMGLLKTLVLNVKDGFANKTARNDKCAACSGMFLEMVSKILGIDIESMGEIAAKSKEKIEVSCTCAVFAESEMISLISMKKRVEDILRGVFIALARRTYPLLVDVGYQKDIIMVGGVANNLGMVKAIEEQLDSKVIIPEFPDIITARGAAILAQERI